MALTKKTRDKSKAKNRSTRLSPDDNTISTVKNRASSSIKKTKNVKLNLKRLCISVTVMVFCVNFICMTIGQQGRINTKNKEIEELNQQIISATQETDKLKEELESVNDPEYLERMAREKLGLVNPNERVYIDANNSGN